ncbi:YraN family protein [Paenibacillus thermotolerans]|uniref:YraN family protein n=1 Tax=Paenibacillus thermotolerans TaxID=3027807 RepID=UPI002367FF75|nr:MULTISPECIES: YraN family protein [unclassified Paenibacillus]
MSRKQTGDEGEKHALKHLLANGYEILHTNWRCKLGELDIIAQLEGMLVFVEVRSRTASADYGFGSPEESVDARKQQKLRRLAELYITMNGFSARPVRFDVIAVRFSRDERVSIRHVEDAL